MVFCTSHRAWRIAIFLCVLGTMSCADFSPRRSTLWPFAEKRDTVAGVKTATERVAELKKLSASAKDTQPEQQARISADLCDQLRREEDPLMRIELINTLAVYRTTIATKMLEAALIDTDAEVREAACAAWGKRGGEDAVGQLTRVLSSDTNLDVRLAAARALGETKSQRAIAPLGEALSDKDPALQNRVVQSLRTISGREYGNDVEAWQQFAKGGHVDTKTPSLAERLRKLF